MMIALIGLALLLIFILVAIRVGVTKGKEAEKAEQPVIHHSGIYSIVRKSPRENIGAHKPSVDELRKYLASQNVDIQGKAISAAEKERLAESWQTDLEKSLTIIEEGDKKGTQFYYYDYAGNDPACQDGIPKGSFVTREQIFHYPNLIPPFHVGCRCVIKIYQGDENLRDTKVFGFKPLISENELPRLPDWKKTLASA
jgi:hypothetical protein